MREVLVGTPSDCADYGEINMNTPIFACLNGAIRGVLIRECGWGLINPDGFCVTGRYASRLQCINAGKAMGYSFFIEE